MLRSPDLRLERPGGADPVGRLRRAVTAVFKKEQLGTRRNPTGGKYVRSARLNEETGNSHTGTLKLVMQPITDPDAARPARL